MKNLRLVTIALVACAAGNARTATSNSDSLCDILPAPTCKDTLPPVKPWDGNALPQPQTDRGFVVIHRDAQNPGSMIAATTDDGTVISLVSLPEAELAKLLLAIYGDDDQKTDAGRKVKLSGKVGMGMGPRMSAEYYRQVAAAELGISELATKRADQCQ